MERIEKIKAGIDGLLEKIANKSESFFRGQAVGLNYVKELIDNTYPELKESEDERIRKMLISLVKHHSDVLEQAHEKEILAYLEKQKEQKPSTEETELNSIAFLEQMGYTCIPPKEQQPSTPEDIAAAYQMGLAKGRNEQKPAEWSEEDKWKLNRIYAILGQAADTHAFSTTCRLIGDKEAIMLQDFLRSIAKPQITDWSEEDEEMLQLLISYFGFPKIPMKINTSDKVVDFKEIASWLKSLRPQPHWKPSEEQMKVFLKANPVNLMPDELGVYHSLYNDLLKKL